MTPTPATLLITLALGMLLAHASPVHAAVPPTAQAVAAGTAPAEDTRVTRLRRPQTSRYTVEGDRFRRAEPLDPAMLPLPARVLAVSPKGYVLVEVASGQVWLDSMDVVLDPPRQLKARCLSVSSHPNRQVAGVSGAGEDC